MILDGGCYIKVSKNGLRKYLDIVIIGRKVYNDFGR